MTNWTAIVKPATLKALDAAGIKGEARKVILRFERSITTCNNRLMDGMAWDRVIYTTAALRADQAMALLSGNVHSFSADDQPKYWEEWVAYCQQVDRVPHTTTSDHLC